MRIGVQTSMQRSDEEIAGCRPAQKESGEERAQENDPCANKIQDNSGDRRRAPIGMKAMAEGQRRTPRCSFVLASMVAAVRSCPRKATASPDARACNQIGRASCRERGELS